MPAKKNGYAKKGGAFLFKNDDDLVAYGSARSAGFSSYEAETIIERAKSAKVNPRKAVSMVKEARERGLGFMTALALIKVKGAIGE